MKDENLAALYSSWIFPLLKQKPTTWVWCTNMSFEKVPSTPSAKNLHPRYSDRSIGSTPGWGGNTLLKGTSVEISGSIPSRDHSHRDLLGRHGTARILCTYCATTPVFWDLLVKDIQVTLDLLCEKRSVRSRLSPGLLHEMSQITCLYLKGHYRAAWQMTNTNMWTSTPCVLYIKGFILKGENRTSWSGLRWVCWGWEKRYF